MKPLRWIVDVSLAVGLLAALITVMVMDYGRVPPDGEGGDSLLTRKRPRSGSVYAERAAENRTEIALKRGGTVESEQAVQNGLDWLIRHQLQDGRWSNKCVDGHSGSVCPKDRPCTGGGVSADVGHTGLALLALQGGGHFDFNETPWSPQVKRGLDWLLTTQTQDGRFVANYHMYEHAIATFALAEAVALAKHSDVAPNPAYVESVTKAIRYIEKAQTPNWGWRYGYQDGGDSSVSGWVVLALKSAMAADIAVSPDCVKSAIAFFKALELPGGDGRTGYSGHDQHTEATTGVGMLNHHFLLEKSDSELILKASPYLAKYAETNWGKPGGAPDYYMWYNCTLGMYLAGGDNWDRWNQVIRDNIIRRQVDGKECDRGSWDPIDRFGAGDGGRVYSTALAVLTLEVYYRFARKK